MKELKLPDYNKESRHRTDATNTGVSAVLLQMNEEDKWVPVQWSSKKLTTTEMRYGISEKEMFAVFWVIKKFEYELRGRKFHLMTDHKALEEIRRKPVFNNNRINRWIEKIQEFDFSVEYVRGDLMVDADVLSRQYQDQGSDIKRKKMSEKGEIVRKEGNNEDKYIGNKGKWKKHVSFENGKNVWQFDSGITLEIPDVQQRESLVLEVHKNLEHKGREAVYYELKKKWHWPGMKNFINDTIKKCPKCQIYNRKKSGGCEFVTTSRKLQKVGLDMIDMREEGKYIMVAIDYFTRIVMAKLIPTKETKNVILTWENWASKGFKPEEIISDNGKEFCSLEFGRWCASNKIRHRKVSIESHRSNGRVERLIHTVEWL